MDYRKNRGVDPTYQLLALCARAEGHPAMYAQLARQVEAFSNWDALPAQAELHGMSSLFWHHLRQSKISIPSKTEQILKGLYLRHRAFNQAYAQALLEVSALFQNVGINFFLLKGLAFAYEYYPDAALRPVSDLDLLLKREDVLPALDALASADFRVDTRREAPSGALLKGIAADSPPRNGIRARVEIHHYDPHGKSAVDNSPDDEFAGFNAPPHRVQINESAVYVPDPLDTLRYVSRHLKGHLFTATDDKPLQLKWIADIINLVERHADIIDWERDPAFLSRLSLFYSLTPLPERYQTSIPIKQIQPPAGVNQYPQGWPQRVHLQWKRAGFLYYFRRALSSPSYIQRTLTPPSRWWLCLYYGIEENRAFFYGQVVYRWQIFKTALAKFFHKFA